MLYSIFVTFIGILVEPVTLTELKNTFIFLRIMIFLYKKNIWYIFIVPKTCIKNSIMNQKERIPYNKQRFSFKILVIMYQYLLKEISHVRPKKNSTHHSFFIFMTNVANSDICTHIPPIINQDNNPVEHAAKMSHPGYRIYYTECFLRFCLWSIPSCKSYWIIFKITARNWILLICLGILLKQCWLSWNMYRYYIDRLQFESL